MLFRNKWEVSLLDGLCGTEKGNSLWPNVFVFLGRALYISGWIAPRAKQFLTSLAFLRWKCFSQSLIRLHLRFFWFLLISRHFEIVVAQIAAKMPICWQVAWKFSRHELFQMALLHNGNRDVSVFKINLQEGKTSCPFVWVIYYCLRSSDFCPAQRSNVSWATSTSSWRSPSP